MALLFRRQGHGRAFAALIYDLFTQKGIKYLRLYVRVDNPRAIEFWEKAVSWLKWSTFSETVAIVHEERNHKARSATSLYNTTLSRVVDGTIESLDYSQWRGLDQAHTP